MGARLESSNIPRGAGDGGARGLVLVAGWVDSWDLPICPGSRGIMIGVDGQLGSSIYLVEQGIRIGLGGGLESSKLGAGDLRNLDLV